MSAEPARRQAIGRRSTAAARRPVRAAVGGMIGVVLTAAMVALAAHQWFHIMALYGFLLGMAGGLMAWMVLDELNPDLQGTRWIAAAGVGTAAVTYLLYEYLRYRFAVAGVTARPGWVPYLRETATQGAAFGRLGRASTIYLGAPFVWGARVLELTIALLTGGGIARAVKLRR